MLSELLPPEINSALIISGPGSGPLLAAATAWENLSAELETTAVSFSSALAELGADWQGMSSKVALASLTPHVAWLHTTAAEAAAAGAQATAAAGAYETARTTSVPLPMVLQNRIRLLTLISTNILGQNTPLIAATEAEYDGYWATDVGAMKVYEASSMAAKPQETLTPPPVQAKGMPAAASAPVTANALAGFTIPGLENIGSTLSGMFANLGNIPLFTQIEALFSPAGWTMGSVSQVGNMAAVPVRLGMSPMSALMSLSKMGQTGAAGLTQGAAGGSNALLDAINTMVSGKMSTVMSGVTGQLSSWGQSVSAQLANASHVGGLSVPQGWGSAVNTVTRAVPMMPNTTVSAVPTVSAGMPGGPFGQALMGALAGRGMGGMGTVAKAGAKAVTRGAG